MIDKIKKDFLKLKNPNKIKIFLKFFQTEKGQYGEGDVFLGIANPPLKELAKKYSDLKISDIRKLLNSEIHEHRTVALFILVNRYRKSDLKIPVAFPIKVVPNSLSKVFSDAGKVQLKIGETSKYPQLTYFFNGLIEAPYKNEYRVLLPSDNNPNPEQNPSLKALDITARVSQSLNEGAFDFVLVNFPNGDIIGHTGDFDAGAKAVSIIDSQLKIITDLTLKTNSTLVILGSHGNFEHMIDPMTGIPDINNTTNPVPIYIVDSKYQKPRPPLSKSTIGILADVAPTILELAGVPKPPDMTGTSLLRYLL